MRSPARSVASLGEVLAARRRHLFVGRTAELDLVRTALAAPPGATPLSVLYVHGPGGIGKTRLLDAIADVAVASGAEAVRIDGRDPDLTPSTLLALLGQAAGATDAASPAPGTRRVLLFDSYERLRHLDGWLRTSLLPSLPDSTLTVIADRRPPAPEWRTEPGWDALLRVVSLRNLDPQDGRRFLEAIGLEEAHHERALAVSHGHPLALSLIADLHAQGGAADSDPLVPDIVALLLRRFLDAEPSPEHLRAAQVCALARTTNEALLRDTLGGDAHAAFEWLRSLSFVETGPEGLVPHDLARDVLDADLRWRDPEEYRDTFHRIWRSLVARLDVPGEREQRRAVADLKFVFRNLPGVLSPVDWPSWGQVDPEPAQPTEHQAIVTLVHDAEGPESARLVQHWIERQPEGFFVLHDPSGSLQGLIVALDLSRASAADRRADPGTDAAWEFAAQHGAPRDDETVTQTRFVIDRQAYQDPSPTMNATPILTFQRHLGAARLSWDFLALAEPERWDEYFAVADLPRAEGADFLIGNRRYGLFAHDFRKVPLHDWITRVADRGLARGMTARSPSEPMVQVLSATEFEQAVRQALQHLHRPDLLARNPLMQSRIVRDRHPEVAPEAATLAGLLNEAIGSLATHPRDDKLFRALDRTYRRPAATREAAAAVLGLPFSTYRRHLSQATSRVVAWLWDRELHGPVPADRVDGATRS